MTSAASQYLTNSRAGMRLIAQLTLYNRADFDRLRAYLAENYAPAALDDLPLADRLAEFEALYEQAGRFRVEQVLGVGEHQVIAALTTERAAEASYVTQMVVEEAYPHRVTQFVCGVLQTEMDEP